MFFVGTPVGQHLGFGRVQGLLGAVRFQLEAAADGVGAEGVPPAGDGWPHSYSVSYSVIGHNDGPLGDHRVEPQSTQTTSNICQLH